MDHNSFQHLLAYVQKLGSKRMDSEFFDPTMDAQAEWVLRQVGRFLTAVGNSLASLGERIQHRQETSSEVSLGGHQESSVHR